MEISKQKISVCTIADLSAVLKLFHEAMEPQTKTTYQVWDKIDVEAVKQDILNGRQYKIEEEGYLACIFSVQYSDPLIWGPRDLDDAMYLHRIITHREFKGQRYFKHVLNWSVVKAREKNLHYLRMDTWASNVSLISYYKSFGFDVVDYFTTTDSPELPQQNRNLNVVLLQMAVTIK